MNYFRYNNYSNVPASRKTSSGNHINAVKIRAYTLNHKGERIDLVPFLFTRIPCVGEIIHFPKNAYQVIDVEHIPLIYRQNLPGTRGNKKPLPILANIAVMKVEENIPDETHLDFTKHYNYVIPNHE